MSRTILWFTEVRRRDGRYGSPTGRGGGGVPRRGEGVEGRDSPRDCRGGVCPGMDVHIGRLRSETAWFVKPGVDMSIYAHTARGAVSLFRAAADDTARRCSRTPSVRESDGMSRQRDYAPAETPSALDGCTTPSPERVRKSEAWTLWVCTGRTSRSRTQPVRSTAACRRSTTCRTAAFESRSSPCRGETYRLTHGDVTVLRKATESRAFRRHSERWGGVLGIASGWGAMFPAPPWRPEGRDARPLDGEAGGEA